MRRGERGLIAGIGNIFLGDDGFGCAVVQAFAAAPFPQWRVVDFGIRGLDLFYELLEGYDAVVLVDTVQRGHAPGTLSLIEPLPVAPTDPGGIFVEAHAMDPERVLGLARAMGAPFRMLRLLGCEPASLEHAMGLSPVVQAAVEPAVSMLTDLAHGLLPEVAEVACTS